MDVLYSLTPTGEGNITYPCNSRYRGKMFLYIDHSHIEYLLYYILILKYLIKTKKILISVSWHTKWDKQQEILSNLTVLIIHINSTCAVIKINPEIVTGQYNSCAGISKVIFPSGCGKWSWNRRNSEKYWISNIKRNLVLKYNIYVTVQIGIQ